MADNPIPPLTLSIYNRIFEDIAAMKKQQWGIGNYSILIFAGVFALVTRDGAHIPANVGRIVVVVTWLIALYLILKVKINLDKVRAHAREIERKHARDEAELNLLGTNAPNTDLRRDAPFLGAIIGTSTVAALLVLYALWNC